MLIVYSTITATVSYANRFIMAEESESRTRTVSGGSSDGERAAGGRRRSFSSAEEGKRSVVVAVDESEDSKFAFECKFDLEYNLKCSLH